MTAIGGLGRSTLRRWHEVATTASRRRAAGLRESLEFDGYVITFEPGDTIGAACVRADRPILGARPSGAPRGIYCGIGVCQECLVDVDEQAALRACVTAARPGMHVRPRGKRGAD